MDQILGIRQRGRVYWLFALCNDGCRKAGRRDGQHDTAKCGGRE